MPTLNFKGKQHIYAHHLMVPHRPLVPDFSKSVLPDAVDSPPSDDNLIIHGDNLQSLKALLPRYAGRINCIYIDPPYNTGNEGWAYNDNVNSPLMQRWLKENGPVDNEDMERHDKWLCMMWPRLHLLRELLSDNGIIFVSIDDNEEHHLRMIMDEIFGEDNFFAVLTRRAMHTVRNSSKDFNFNADYILVYAKVKKWFSEDKSKYIRYLSDKSSKYPHDDNDGCGQYKLDPIHARNYYEPYSHTFKNGVRWMAPEGRYPSFSQETLRQLEKENRIVFDKKEPLAKRYLFEVQEGQPPDVILSPKLVGFNASGTRELHSIFGYKAFPQPKPTKLIGYLLSIIRQPDAIVLDSFAGSGTTAHAVMALNKEDNGNRKFILVECEDYTDSVTAERVRRIIKGVPDSNNGDLHEGLGGSFTYCTLGDPIDMESMLSGEHLPSYSDLASFLLHTASGISVGTQVLKPLDEDGLFYTDDRRVYYLLYKPDVEYLKSNEAMLNDKRAKMISTSLGDKKGIVFAAGKFLRQSELSEWGITFCQVPYQFHRIG